MGRFKDRARAESYLEGLGDNPVLLHILGIRYFITPQIITLPGFEPLMAQGDVFALRSIFDLSMGFVYERSVSERDMESLVDSRDRHLMMLRGIILSDKASSPDSVTNINSFKRTADGASELNWEAISERLRILENRKVNFSEVGSNHVVGEVRTDVDGYLFIPIAFDKGWRLEIDGQPVEIERGNIGFIAAQIKAGDHKFELNYRPPTLIPSLIAFALGLSILVFLRESKSRKSSKDQYI
ncbi:MAG: hypothetical protein EOP09_11990 [Proteobacteria bacterium]|nr:MAG: hypothetical protein EOP09_11990 [Pseudomonadota bacterium]